MMRKYFLRNCLILSCFVVLTISCGGGDVKDNLPTTGVNNGAVEAPVAQTPKEPAVQVQEDADEAPALQVQEEQDVVATSTTVAQEDSATIEDPTTESSVETTEATDTSLMDSDSTSGTSTATGFITKLDPYYVWYKTKRPKVVNKDSTYLYGFAYNHYSGVKNSTTTLTNSTIGSTATIAVNNIKPLPTSTTNITKPLSGGFKFPIAGSTGDALRLDVAVDTRLHRILVVYERALDGTAVPRTEIRGQFYDVDGNKLGQDVLISVPPSADHHIDPKFHDVPAFAALTEPLCNSYANPTVVFVEGRTAPEDRYLIAYEAHCEGDVKWPKDVQFLNNPQPANPIFDLAKTDGLKQQFSVIQAVKLAASDLHTLQANERPGPFTSPRTMGRLFAWFLFNNAAPGGLALLNDTSIWKWSSAVNPHLSVSKDPGKDKTVLLTYQTNLKFTTCLSNRLDLTDAEQQGRYETMFSIDGQIVQVESREKPFSIFRSSLTAADNNEANPQADMCVKFEQATELESAYDPVSAYNPAPSLDKRGLFATLFSVEKGTVDKFYAQDATLNKNINGNLVYIDLQNNNVRVPFAVNEDVGYKIQYLIGNKDLGEMPVLGNETKHSDPDIIYDDLNKYFIAAFDDGNGVHTFLLNKDAAVIDLSNSAVVTKGANWTDTLAQHAFRPSLSEKIDATIGELDISKVGVSYHFKSSSGDKWLIGQNYAQLFINSLGIPEFGFEKVSDENYNLTTLAEAQENVQLSRNFGPVSASMSWGENAKRFRTFWIGSPAHDGNDMIYTVYVPEGMSPVALFDVVSGNVTMRSEDASGKLRVNDISAAMPLGINLVGSRSNDPDKEAGAVANGIAVWSWKVEGVDVQMAPIELLGQLANFNVTSSGTYKITLKVSDASGLTSSSEFAIRIVKNVPPTVATLDLFYVDGQNEIPLLGENPKVLPGQTVVLRTSGSDGDLEDGTPADQLRFNWAVSGPDGAAINTVSIDGTRKVSFVAASIGRYVISVSSQDLENAISGVLTKNLTVEAVSVDRFVLVTPGIIDLSLQSVQGNPTPQNVYGEAIVAWGTTRAESIRLLKKEWETDANMGAGDPVDVAADDIVGLPAGGSLPITSDGLTVHLHRKTSLMLEITGRGVTVRSDPVVISFGPASARMTAAQIVNFANDMRDGASPLTWGTTNVREVHLEAYEWRDFQTEPNYAGAPTRRLDPAQGFLQLNQAEPLVDRITKKTTYILKATDLYGRQVAINNNNRKVVEFQSPQIDTFTADPATVDFVQGTNAGQTTLNWTTHNVTSVRAYANDVEINGSPFQTDARGAGTVTVPINGVINYRLAAFNPDGRPVQSQNVAVRFNDPSIELSVPRTVQDQAIPLYFGREAIVTWSNSRNVADMTLYLVEENGNIVQGYPQQHVAGIAAVLGPPRTWSFVLPNVNNPPLAGVNYKIRADIVNPNGGNLVTSYSSLFAVLRRPSPRIDAFSVLPVQIEDLFSENGATVGHSVLSWQASNVSANAPIVSIRSQKNGAGWSALPENFDALTSSGSLNLTVGTNDAPVNYELTVRNSYDDRITTGGRGYYIDEPSPPVNPQVRFASPSVVGWTLAEADTYPERPIHVSWQSRTATFLEVVLVNNGNQTVLYSTANLAEVLSSNEVAIILPNYEDEGVAQIKINLTGPGGISSSDPLNLNLRQIPRSGIVSFCAVPSYPANSQCNIHTNLDLEPGRFNNPTAMTWTVDTSRTERVVRLCVGAAPDQNGACDGRAIELSAGPNFVDQGGGVGVGSHVINMNQDNTYWVVAKPLGQAINIAFEIPVDFSFNEPVIGTFSGEKTVINQGNNVSVSWRNVTNATRVSLQATAGDQVMYSGAGGNLIALPLTVQEDAEYLPAANVTITTANAVPMRLVLTATGPGGAVSSSPVDIDVNDIPNVAPEIITPAGDLELYTPTRLFVEWNASEARLDDDQGVTTDSDGIASYALCYSIYETDRTGAIIDAGGNKENDRLENEGVPCPDVTTNTYASMDELPAGLIYIQPTRQANCAQAGSNCRVVANQKIYHYALEMDPKLNNDDHPYLRYEMKVLTIDNGHNGILGIKEAAELTRVVTDDSVEAWWKFNENFADAAAPNCPDMPVGFTICDSGRRGHHLRPHGSPGWANPGVILNPNEENTQYLDMYWPLPVFSELTMEFWATARRLAGDYFLNIGASGGTPFGDWVITFATSNNRVRCYLTRNSGAETMSVAFSQNVNLGQQYHLVSTIKQNAFNYLYVNGIADPPFGSVSVFDFPDYRRYILIGKTGAAGSTMYNGTIREGLIYTRQLSAREVQNNYNAYPNR